MCAGEGEERGADKTFRFVYGTGMCRMGMATCSVFIRCTMYGEKGWGGKCACVQQSRLHGLPAATPLKLS